MGFFGKLIIKRKKPREENRVVNFRRKIFSWDSLDLVLKMF